MFLLLYIYFIVRIIYSTGQYYLVCYLFNYDGFVFVLLYFLCMFCWSVFFFFKQKTAYELRISDWSSDVCSSDLPSELRERGACDAVAIGLQGRKAGKEQRGVVDAQIIILRRGGARALVLARHLQGDRPEIMFDPQ